MSRGPGMAETRRRALIGAALREISDRGSLDVTVAQIAGRAGVSAALAHHYFGAKDDLILATMRHLLAEFGAVVVAGLRRADSPRARLSAIIRGSFGPEQFHRATISAWLTFYAWALRSPAAARLLRHLPAPAAQQPRPCAQAAGPADEAAPDRRGPRGADRRGLPARGAARPPDRAGGGDRRCRGLPRPRALARRPGGAR